MFKVIEQARYSRRCVSEWSLVPGDPLPRAGDEREASLNESV
jgi:hypothetical protein